MIDDSRLQELSAKLDGIAGALEAVKIRIAAIETRAAANGAKKPIENRVATDAELDGEYGDIRIRYGLKEKYWKEQPDRHVGMRFSECEAEYLDAFAKYLSACAFMARKDGDEKKAGYKDLDAARARGWAARIRANGGATYASPEESAAYGADDDIPF